MPTLMVMAGGTGGHIYPGLAVADALRDRGWRVVWMGNPDGMEARIVPANGYEVAWVRFTALRGKGVLRKLLLPFNLLRGFAQALGQIRRVKPDVVLGMGGYVTFPGGMMAALLGRPVVVHEQNSVAGLANRVLAGVADKVVTGFPDVLKKGEWIGNPVRADITAVAPPAQRFAGRSGPLKVLVVGGSLGAAALNDALPKALALLAPVERPQVTHQAGTRQIDALKAGYKAAGVEGELLPFIDDMAARYAWCDVLVCRAGAITVAEIAAAGVAAILFPLPWFVADEQAGNAMFLERNGAGIRLAQLETTPESLASLLGSLTREKLCAMASKARALGRPDATARCADLCESLAT